MNQLKEHRILVALIGGVVLALLGHMLFVMPEISEAEKYSKKNTKADIDALKTAAASTPKDAEIEERKAERLKILKQLYNRYLAYQKLAFPLKTFLIPGTTEDTQSTEFVTKLRVQISNVLKHYNDFRVLPKVVADDRGGMSGQGAIPDNPFQDFANKKFEGPGEVRLAQKQFWVMVEVVNALIDAIQETKDARPDKQAPVCAIRAFNFLPLKPLEPRTSTLGGLDVTGLFQGIPFEVDIICDADVWPRFRAALYSPKAVVVQWKPQDQNADDVVKGRRGIRFDRVSSEVKLWQVVEHIDVDLANDPLAQELFNKYWPDRFRDGQVYPPDSSKGLQFLDDVRKKLYPELVAAKAPANAQVVTKISGEALDFMPDETKEARTNFFKALNLTSEDVYGILFNGENTNLSEERKASWPKCALSGTPTRNLPTILPNEPYIRKIVQEAKGTPNDDPFAPIIVGEEKLREIADRIVTEKIGATAAATPEAPK